MIFAEASLPSDEEQVAGANRLGEAVWLDKRPHVLAGDGLDLRHDVLLAVQKLDRTVGLCNGLATLPAALR
jgi:hypothetical protein